MKHTVIVYIGRFEPAHHGHIATMRAALERSNHLVVVIGSHNAPRDIKNPWTAEERSYMIRASLTPAENERVSFVYAENRLYNNPFWARNVEQLVNEVVSTLHFIKPTIAIIGNGKGDKETSEYVDYFKQWPRVPMECITLGNIPLHATKIRELYLTGHLGFVQPAVPEGVFKFMQDFQATETYTALKEEYDFHIKEEKKYEHVPYGSYTRYTADPVVIQSGHVLLIKRGKAPGKGLWALPGGHVEQVETAYEGAIRELFEETNIDLQRSVIERGMFYEKMFDHPERSMVGRVTKKLVRTASMAFGFKLDDKRSLPMVKAGDDAGEARWFSFAEISNMRNVMYEDHLDIVEFMLGRVS